MNAPRGSRSRWSRARVTYWYNGVKYEISSPWGMVGLGNRYHFPSFDLIGDLALGELIGCLFEHRYYP